MVTVIAYLKASPDQVGHPLGSLNRAGKAIGFRPARQKAQEFSQPAPGPAWEGVRVAAAVQPRQPALGGGTGAPNDARPVDSPPKNGQWRPTPRRAANAARPPAGVPPSPVRLVAPE
jgi:hypothetical protein